MSKKYLLVLVIALSSQNLMSQHVLNQFLFANGQRLQKVSCQSLGDQMLLGYQQLLMDASWQFSCYLVTTQGVLKQIQIEKDQFYSIIATAPVNSNIWRLYFTIEKGNKLFLKSVDLDLITGAKVYSQNQLVVTNRLIGSRLEGKDLFLYSIDRNNGLDMMISKIESLDAVEETHYLLPIDLNSYKESDLAFITATNYVSISESLEKVKFVPTRESVEITIDEYKNTKKDKTSGTLLVHLDLSTKASQTTFIEEPADLTKVNMPVARYRSYALDGYLFRTLLQPKLFTLKIFDGKSGELIQSKLFPKDKEARLKNVVFRDGTSLEVRQKTLAHLVAGLSLWRPFVIVGKDSVSDKFSIVCGTHMNKKKGGAPILFVNPASIIASFILTTGRQLSDGSGVSHYFYYTGDLKNGFEYYSDDPFNGLRQKMDSFEMNPQYEHISSCFYKKGILGIYYDRSDRKMKLIEF